jgi:ribonuclease HI
MIEHSYDQVRVQTYVSKSDLTDKKLVESEDKWFTDGSSFVLSGERKVRYAVVSHEEVIEAPPLLTGTSAQKAELIALTRALTLGKGKQLNICTDSKPAFLVLHVLAATWKEKGLLFGETLAQ